MVDPAADVSDRRRPGIDPAFAPTSAAVYWSSTAIPTTQTGIYQADVLADSWTGALQTNEAAVGTVRGDR
jgi:hypothetical protein